MKRIFHLSTIIAAIGLLTTAGLVWAGPVAPACTASNRDCFVRDGNLYCSIREDVTANKLVRGRAGQLEWVRTPSSHMKIEKCADGVYGSVE